METLLGIKGPDFVMLAADTTHARSIIVMKEDQNKIHKASDNLLISTTGESGDTEQFTEFISKNIALYKMRNGYDLSPRAAAHFTRKNLADYLRSRTPYQVFMFVAGYDETDGAELAFIDYLANAKSLNHAGHGYGAMFCSSIYDRYWHPNITQDEAYDIFKKCIVEIQKRLVVNLKNFNVSVVDKNGVRNLEPISAQSLTDYNASS
ncbi:probable proteasome subunit beta type-2 [Drosophila miranda]|uniref:Proteasome subunit beta n=1 Tax=Drosophila pseudoobscura pseudoobscura TaxID=46245 RepID=Q29MT6_DROPS|nr:probable proteasome subunit beta type-2 [Drosophila pseudoobscura]XP_017155116.1 probable proteasome subunit beta type-2 [Drosophila miranda]XP_026844094.1 probable proteasome subunit beta type-2 [Drosophila persimilis]